MSAFSPAGQSLNFGSAGVASALDDELNEIRRRQKLQQASQTLSPAGNSLLTLGASRFGIGLGTY
jgi:hypothetical protein